MPKGTVDTPNPHRSTRRSGSDWGAGKVHKPEGSHQDPPNGVTRRGPPPSEAPTLLTWSAGDSVEVDTVRGASTHRDSSAGTLLSGQLDHLFIV